MIGPGLGVTLTDAHLWPLWNKLARLGQVGRWSVLTLALNYAVSGLDSWSYHLANLAIHAHLRRWLCLGSGRRTLQGPRLRDRFGTQGDESRRRQLCVSGSASSAD